MTSSGPTHASSSSEKRARFNDDEPSVPVPQPEPQADDDEEEEEALTVLWASLVALVSNDPVIKKEIDDLSAADMITYKKEVFKAMVKELMSFHDLSAIKLGLKGTSGNCMTSRWVIRFKMIEGLKAIKARLTVHGFKDADAETLSTYASTACKWAQRLVCATAAQMRWELCSADVSSAFIRSLTFEEMAKLNGTEVRTAGFLMPKGSEEALRQIPGFEKYDPTIHEVVMCKPIYGLKDAPRAWRQRLHASLIKLKGRNMCCDASLYAWYTVTPGSSTPTLTLLCSTHVDDLKICGTPECTKMLLERLRHVEGSDTQV